MASFLQADQRWSAPFALAAGSGRAETLAPCGPLPVPARPLSGEMLASYLSRLAGANHIPVSLLLSALPAWLTRKFASHHARLPGEGTGPAAAEARDQLATIAGTPVVSIARALPVFGGGADGPARAVTACRRCAAAHGAAQPVPVHLPAYQAVCARHGIWLPRPGLPQLDISACPEIVTAHHRARKLLMHFTPEQLIYAQVEAAELPVTRRLPGWAPSPAWQQRVRPLRTANPRLRALAESELARAARYPDTVTDAAAILAFATTASLIQTDAPQPRGLWPRQIN
jgi:hypothetical protein